MNEKLVLEGLFKNLYKDSRDNLLRVSLSYPGKKETLITSDVNVLYDVPYYHDLLNDYYEKREDIPDDLRKDVEIYEDIHFFLGFLYSAEKAGFKILPFEESEQVLIDTPYKYSVYNVELNLDSITGFVDDIFKDNQEEDLIGFLQFCAFHVEFYI